MSSHAAYSSIDELLVEADSIRSKNPQKLFDLINRIEKSIDNLNSEQQSLYYFLRGYEAGIKGDYDRAVEYYNKVLAGNLSTSLRIKVLVSYVNILAVNRDAVKGFKIAQDLIDLLPKVSIEEQNEALTTLSLFYNQIDEFESTLQSAEKVKSSSKNSRSICYANFTLVEARYHLKQNFNLENLDKFANECKQIGEINPAAMIMSYKARLLSESGRNDFAIQTLNENFYLVEKSGYPWLKAWYSSLLAEFYFNVNDINNSKTLAEESLRLVENDSFSKPRLIALFILSKLFESTSDYNLALKYFKEYSDAKLASIDETKARQLAIQQAKNDALEKANQIKLLDKENALLKTQAALDRTDIENSRLVIVTLVLLGTVIIIWLAVTRRMHRQLKIQAQTDKLTGIANRHYFTKLTESNLRYHARTKQNLAFAVFDLDLFKRINDTHGHIVGDWALQKVVQAVQNVCRGQDIIGRMGGEEFALLLPGCDIERAMLLTENCRSAIAAIDTSESGASFTITASFGVTDTNRCGYKFDQLYACADQALYRSKEEGRNMVYRYEPAEFEKQFVSQPV